MFAATEIKTVKAHKGDTIMSQNLKGFKILDLSRVLAGPYCTMMLGDLGASVIKVERPGTGDDTRGWGPPFDDRGQAAYFLSANRNKLSLAADFRNADDLQLLRSLIAEADIVIENYLPGVLARNGLDSDLLMAQNAKLIWCTISGFGPESQRPGYDFVAQAESGWMAITGEPDGEPMKVGVALVDVIAGKDAAIGILAAVAGRDRAARDGEVLPAADRRVHVTLASSAVAALVNVTQNSLVSGKPSKRWGNAHPNLVPYQLFHAEDRPLVIAVGNDGQWQQAAKALGLADLAADPALATNAGRLAQRDRVVSAIAARVGEASAQQWVSRLDAVGVPCGLVREVHEALADVTASARTGVTPLLNGRVRFEPPLLDEHGVTIREKQWSSFDVVPILE
ncbi:MAG TPA: CoA transferase [Gemmatimonas sp.]|uniref:CaiB/BaiF CoA transferase family protein n=1 Tax=Gemmatimonas sp. TaxID=1962908 RepID=UPI002EDA1535